MAFCSSWVLQASYDHLNIQLIVGFFVAIFFGMEGNFSPSFKCGDVDFKDIGMFNYSFIFAFLIFLFVENVLPPCC